MFLVKGTNFAELTLQLRPWPIGDPVFAVALVVVALEPAPEWVVISHCGSIALVVGEMYVRWF